MIQFSLFDKDIITSDDFGGETYFPLSSVPGNKVYTSLYHYNLLLNIFYYMFTNVVPKSWILISGVAGANASIGNYHGLKKLHMPLTYQQEKGKQFCLQFK